MNTFRPLLLSLPYSTKFFNPRFRSTCTPFFIKKKSGANPEKQRFQKRISVYLRMRKQRGTKRDSKYVFLSIVNRLAFHPHFPRELKENPSSIDERISFYFNFHFTFDVSQSVEESNFFKFFHFFFLPTIKSVAKEMDLIINELK